MKTIKMLSTHPGSESGITVTIFEENKVYTISDNLYETFNDFKWCQDYKGNEEPVKSESNIVSSVESIQEEVKEDSETEGETPILKKGKGK